MTTSLMLLRKCLSLESELNKSVNSVLEERKILENLHHPLLINMRYAFQTRSHLYVVMDFLTGGDMRYHFINGVKFNERETKFIVA